MLCERHHHRRRFRHLKKRSRVVCNNSKLGITCLPIRRGWCSQVGHVHRTACYRALQRLRRFSTYTTGKYIIPLKSEVYNPYCARGERKTPQKCTDPRASLYRTLHHQRKKGSSSAQRAGRRHLSQVIGVHVNARTQEHHVPRCDDQEEHKSLQGRSRQKLSTRISPWANTRQAQTKGHPIKSLACALLKCQDRNAETGKAAAPG